MWISIASLNRVSNLRNQAIKESSLILSMSGQEPLPTVVGALLLRAAKRGSLILVRAILSHPSCDLMARDKEGSTALHIAASRGYCDIVEELAAKI